MNGEEGIPSPLLIGAYPERFQIVSADADEPCARCGRPVSDEAASVLYDTEREEIIHPYCRPLRGLT